MGPGISAECTAQFPVVENSGPVTYCFSPVVHPKPNGFSFMTGPAIGDVEPVVLRYFRSRGFRNFALITSTDASGQEFERTFDLALALPEFRDVKLVAREHFNISDISVSAQVARIKAARPEVLLTFTTGTPFGTLLHGLYDAGLEIPVYGSGGNLNNAQMAQYAAFLPKELYLNGVHGVIPDPTATGKMKQAQQIYFDALKRASYHPEFSLLSVWDPTMIVVDALRKLRSDVTAQQLHDYLEHLKGWTGVEGTYDFTSGDQRGIGQAATALFRWDATAIDWVQVSPAPHHR
jgi:branched-chain amino acid transport system substrate-binding protein